MNVSLPSMLKLLQRIVDINNAGGFYRPILTLSMRAFGPRNSAYAFWTKTDTHTYRHISREISIEHPSVGLASLAQLEKWFPFQGERAHSLLLFLYMLIERMRRRGRQNYNNSLPKVVTFFTDYKYTTSP